MNYRRPPLKVAASYTVEAALVFPVVFFVVLFMFNYILYSYDRAKLQAELNDLMRVSASYTSYEVGLDTKAVDRVAVVNRNILWILFGNRDLKKEAIEKYAREKMNQGLYITEIESINAEFTFATLTVRGSAKVNLIGLDWAPNIFRKPFEINIGQQTSIFPREEKARILQAVYELGTSIKGVDRILERFSGFVNNIR